MVVTEEQFRQALSDIVAGLSNPRAIIPQILIVAAYFAQKFTPFPTGELMSASNCSMDFAEIDCGVEFRSFCDAIDCGYVESELTPSAIDVDSNLAKAGGLGAMVAIALAKRALTALAEKIEDPTIKAAILSLLKLIG